MSDPMDCSPSGSSVHEIFQAKILESVAIPFPRRSFQPKVCTQVSGIEGGPEKSWWRERQKPLTPEDTLWKWGKKPYMFFSFSCKKKSITLIIGKYHIRILTDIFKNNCSVVFSKVIHKEMAKEEIQVKEN